MGNDIEIRVRVANDTASGLAAVNTSLRGLRNNARDAGQALQTLTARSTAAAASLQLLHSRAEAASRALGELRDGTTGTNNALRTLNTRAQTADGRLNTLSGRARTLRSGMDDLDGSVQRVTGNLGGLRTGLGSLPSVTARSSGGMHRLKMAALALSPALIPIAAAAAPIAAGLAAAGVAMGAFGLAIGKQVSAIAEAAEAEKKYRDAVREHGQNSEEAAKADIALAQATARMPKATREAAAALSVMKQRYTEWSDSLADSTMPVATKSFAAFGALLPRLTPLVRGTSSELERLMTVMAGGIQSQGFERFIASFSEFASGALQKATNGLIHFSRVMAGGAGSGAFSEFMAYVRDVGPAVGETLGNLARALTHLVASASDLGVSMLSVVNALAKLVNAIPTSAIATFLQFALAFKAVQLAAAGLAGAGGALAAFRTQLIAANTAAGMTSGGLAGLTAAFGALSRGAKVALIASGIGILVVALSSLAEMGKKAPPNIDKMTTSLGRLATTGKLSGEAARVLGADMGKLAEAVRGMERPSNLDKVQQSLTSLIGMDSTPVQGWKETLEGLDKGLANLVKGGHAEQAEEVFKRSAEFLKGKGLSTGELRKNLDDYKSALADLKLEQELTARSMGLFGEQAIATQQKLNAQKLSADGLRQSIQALNEVNRAGLGGMIGFEAAIDAAAKAARENAGSLRMVGGELDLNSPKAQTAATALQDLAAKTDEAAASARQADGNWTRAFQVYDRGRKKLIDTAQAMGLTKAEAKKLADQILKTPDKKIRLKADKEDAERDLRAFNAAVKRSPGKKEVHLKALSKAGEKVLESFGLKVKRLKDGSVTVHARTGGALSAIGNVRGALGSLDGRTATATVVVRTIGVGAAMAAQSLLGSFGRSADGNIYGRAYANGGMEQHVAQIAQPTMRVWAEPETGGEAYIPLTQSKRGRSLAILEEVADRFGYSLEKYARGGVSKAERDARRGARGDLTISHFGQMAGFGPSEFRQALGNPADIKALVSALNSWRGTIMKATHGGTERRLLRQLDRVGRGLVRHERALDRVNDQLDKAKTKLSDLRSAASQLRDSVASNIRSAANITSLAGGDGRVTVGGILGHLGSVRDQAASFAGALGTLKKRGLSKSILSEIASAGLEGGGLKTAEALMGASSSDIALMNRLRGQISTSASKAGSVTADAMYGAGIKAAEGLIKGLRKKQGGLEDAMEDAARAMAKSLKRAFGIGGKASGGIVGAASGGARGGMTWVGEQGPELVRLPFGSMVYPAGQSRQMAYAPGFGGGARQVVEVVVTLDGKVLARQMVDPLRDEIRGRTGGDVQKALGR